MPFKCMYDDYTGNNGEDKGSHNILMDSVITCTISHLRPATVTLTFEIGTGLCT
jgi:hypothetical protein